MQNTHICCKELVLVCFIFLNPSDNCEQIQALSYYNLIRQQFNKPTAGIIEEFFYSYAFVLKNGCIGNKIEKNGRII